MVWILETGEWSDSGEWDDDSVWNDFMASDSENKPNIQLFRNDTEYGDRMFKIINQANIIQQASLWNLKDTVAISSYFAGYVWDNNLMDLAEFFTREYWVDNFSSIIDSLSRVGTFEAYIEIIQSALGVDTLIAFDNPAAGHLIIYVQSGTAQVIWGATDGINTSEVVTELGDNIVFAKTQSSLTVNETEALIRLLVPSGIFLEIIFGILPVELVA